MAGGAQNSVRGVAVEAAGRDFTPQLTRRRLRRASGPVGSALVERLVDIGGGEDAASR